MPNICAYTLVCGPSRMWIIPRGELVLPGFVSREDRFRRLDGLDKLSVSRKPVDVGAIFFANPESDENLSVRSPRSECGLTSHPRWRPCLPHPKPTLKALTWKRGALGPPRVGMGRSPRVVACASSARRVQSSACHSSRTEARFPNTWPQMSSGPFQTEGIPRRGMGKTGNLWHVDVLDSQWARRCNSFINNTSRPHGISQLTHCTLGLGVR